MRILVTGGAGFIGSHSVRALLDRGDEIVCVDSFNDAYDPRQKEFNISPFLSSAQFSVKRSDILDDQLWTQLAQEKPFDKILHLAARAGVRPSLENPLLYEEVNVRGTLKVLDFARAHGQPHLVVASSSSVYGGQEKVPFSEDDPLPPPLSPYAASKQSMEQFCSAYHEAYGQSITCLRFFTVYGPACRPDMATSLFTQKILRGEIIQQFGEGQSRRDYTYVSDIVDGILSALEKPMNYEVINLGNETPVALKDLVKTLEEILQKKARVEILPLQTGDMIQTYADIRKAKKLLNYQPKVDLREGLSYFIEWLKSSPSFHA